MRVDKTNYYLIRQEKETIDLQKLRDIIKNNKWLDANTVIVTCCPDYSGIGSQILNHGLSHLNRNELFEQVSLEIPYPNTNQVFNRNTFEYEVFDKYLVEWVNKNMSTDFKYLFFDSGTLTGKNFNKISQILRTKGELDYRFASLYVQDDSVFTPDYYVEKFNFEKDGGLLFYWENFDNPNWNY